MKKNHQPPEKGNTRRTLLTFLGTLAFLYPVLQFAGFKIPKKPTYVNISKPVPATGYLVTTGFILFDRDNKCWALSRTCTHLGCKLNYQEDKDILECPCHQSRFNVETGQVVKGPAQKPLTFLPVEKRQDDPLYVVTT
ncbi:Rieske (2Fe-2S) protein [Desulfopila sp. IMCC35006]|uniref:ubiquinol-cytochrome c reductase iron-sulfur subunit n=1 Tax=Desulfopila sp. IMCC35006 TaxID=2569542 RepID=UPI0010AC50D4|nr:Rieske (2Fe-2S) protein [Desulfopila sp. IMCC35006]TKB28093.1 Rieske (2Fe-2S) protein [Desulfopila sp. IMCC35006]